MNAERRVKNAVLEALSGIEYVTDPEQRVKMARAAAHKAGVIASCAIYNEVKTTREAMKCKSTKRESSE